MKEADTIARCLLLNSHSKPYHWEATISFQDENQDENQTETHKRTWARVARRLKGLNLFWVREVDEQDHLHYHFIILGDHDEQELRDKLRASVHDARAKVHVDKIRTLASWCRYIVKAKKRGIDEWGERSSDKWASKRVLFSRHCGLSKHGTIGEFWAVPLKELRKKVGNEKRKWKAHEDERQRTERTLLASATQDERERASCIHALLGVTIREALLSEVGMRDCDSSPSDPITNNSEATEFGRLGVDGEGCGRGKVVRDLDEQDAEVQDEQDAEYQDAEVQDAEVQDAEVQDAEVQDAEVQEAEVQEAEVQDAEVQDAEVQDAEVQEAEVQDQRPTTDPVQDAEVQDPATHDR